jgi:hypothetical protein
VGKAGDVGYADLFHQSLAIGADGLETSSALLRLPVSPSGNVVRLSSRHRFPRVCPGFGLPDDLTTPALADSRATRAIAPGHGRHFLASLDLLNHDWF